MRWGKPCVDMTDMPDIVLFVLSSASSGIIFPNWAHDVVAVKAVVIKRT